MLDPWKAEPLGEGRFRFTNMSGRKLAMITLSPVQGAEVRVEDGTPLDELAVPHPVNSGASFTAVVRGAGVRVTATAVPAMEPVYWELAVS